LYLLPWLLLLLLLLLLLRLRHALLLPLLLLLLPLHCLSFTYLLQPNPCCSRLPWLLRHVPRLFVNA
jgi:hypothetical protein